MDVWDSDVDPAATWSDDSDLKILIKKLPSVFYSDFITRLTFEIARTVCPNARALANKDVVKNYLSASKIQQEVIAKSSDEAVGARSIDEWFSRIGETILNANAYPLLSFLRALRGSDVNEPLASQLGGYEVEGIKLDRSVHLAGLIENVLEGHWKILNDKMLEAIKTSWFDYNFSFSCDTPVPNLLINSLLGLYGRPYHPNVRTSLRFKYTAKSTTMYTDVISMDQARYFYDWFPVVHSVASRFESIPFQVLARCILDRLGRNDWSCGSHPFKGAAVVGWDEIACAGTYEMPERVEIR